MHLHPHTVPSLPDTLVSARLSRREVLVGAAAVSVASLATATGGVDAAPGLGIVAARTETAPAPGAPPGSTQGVGFVLSHEQFPVPQLIDFAAAAEQAGFDTLWTSDHIQPWEANQGHAGQAWVTLGAVGQRTRRVTYGTGVTCPTYRYDPAVVAQTFATLGLVNPGRVFLGVGSGEALNEQTATGTWGTWQERNDRLIEAVDLIRQLWSGATVSYSGRFFKTLNLKFYDLPAQPVPIYLAANGPKAMYRAGRYGDGLITDPKMLMDAQAMANFRRGATEAGKDPGAMPILTESFVHVGGMDEAKEAAQLWRFLPKAWKPYVNIPDPVTINKRADAEVPLDDVIKDWTVSADPMAHVQGIKKLWAMGVTQVYIHSAQADQRAVIDFYGAQVIPQLRG